MMTVLTVSWVMSLTLLTPRLLRWHWSLRAPNTVVCSTIYMDCSLKRLGCRLLHHLCVHCLCPSLLLRLRRLPHFTYIGSIVCAPLLCTRIVTWLPSSYPDAQNVWYCLSVWPLMRLRVTVALSRAVPITESLLFLLESPLRTNLQLGITVRVTMALKAFYRTQSEGLSYALWVLSGLLAFVRLQDFTPADPALFNQLVTALSMRLALQAQVSASHTAFLVNVAASSACLTSRLILALSLCDRCSLPLRFLRIPSFLRRTFLVSSRRLGLHLPSSRNRPWLIWLLGVPPPRPPFIGALLALLARRRRPSSASPSRASKRVWFNSPAPSSAFNVSSQLAFSGLGVMSLAWLFFLSSVLCVFPLPLSLLLVRFLALGAFVLLLFLLFPTLFPGCAC